MKNLMISLISFLLLFNFSIDSIVAQSDDDQLYLIRTIKVEPAKRAAFEEALKTAHAAFREAKVSNLEYYINSTYNYEYFAATPIDNMAALDQSYWGEAISKIGLEKFMKLVSPIEETWTETQIGIYNHRKDWNLDHPSLKDTPMGYRQWEIYEFKPGTAAEVEAIMKEWISLMKEKDIVRKQRVYEAIFGPNENMLVMTLDAKNAAAFSQERAKFWEKTGDKGRALWKRTEAILVNFETREGAFRPDLSMMPAPKDRKSVV